MIGYLVPIEEAEVIPGYNDYSVMCSSRVGMQWVMLGPISFINASCKPNVSYVKVENIMVCAPLRVIEEGEELTISYHNHFFGQNSKDCLCPHKHLHGDPFPDIPFTKGEK